MHSLFLLAGVGQTIYCVLLFLTALFLILLILVQRGRGGGLSGAFGGMGGGQSAFGTKAGDTFTKVTIVAAAFWIVLCIAGVKLFSVERGALSSAAANSVMSAPPMDESEDSLGTAADDLVPDAGDSAAGGAAAGGASEGGAGETVTSNGAEQGGAPAGESTTDADDS